MQPCDLLNVKNACAPQQRLSADRLLCSAHHNVAMPVAAPSHTAVTADLTVPVTARIIRPTGDRHRVLWGQYDDDDDDDDDGEGDDMTATELSELDEGRSCNHGARGTGWESGTSGTGREASHAERVN